MSPFGQKPTRVSITVTWYFNERDAEAVAYDLHGFCEQPANRSDLRGYLKYTIRRALDDVRSRYADRPAEEHLISKKENQR
jgi:hypothetical protein